MSQPLASLVKDWKRLLAADKFKELFHELEQHLNGRSEAFNQCVALERRYNKLHKSEIERTISHENAVLEYSQISKALIDTIDALQISDLEETGSQPENKPKQVIPSKKPTPTEEYDWEFTTEDDNRAAYEKHLARFPGGYYAEAAQKRLEAFVEDDDLWELALERGTEKAFQRYLEKYPNGFHVAEAQQKIVAERRRPIDPFYDLMILIKGGTFEMGDTFGEGYGNEKPIHKVTLSDFWLCKYPVTQGLWKAIMGENNNPSNFKGDDLLPVSRVSWDDAQEFIQVLNKKTGGQYRLPTEAEWEYAAREGGKKIRFGNGKEIANPAEMNFCAKKDYKQPYSIVGEYRAKATPVNHFKPNALGLYDMAGNVYDWCSDCFTEDYYQQCHAQGIVLNPQGLDTGGFRVLRGGGWVYFPLHCRATWRVDFRPTFRHDAVGFRVASSLQ